MMNVEDEGVSNVDLGDDKEELASTLDLGSNEKEGVPSLQLGDVKEEGVSTVDLGSNKEEGVSTVDLGSSKEDGVSSLHLGDPISPESPSVDEGYQPGSPSMGSPEDEEAPPNSTPASGPPLQAQAAANRWVSVLDQFKMKRFFVLRPGTLTQAIEDITALVDKEQDGAVQGLWLMAEVDHWNNERERVVVLTDSTLLVCKYDFVMLNCERIHRIPLNCIDRISHGDFSFPKHSLLTREGDGVRVFWDRLREPSFASRWNPFTVDYPYMTFTDHPVRAINDKFSTLCDVQDFRVQLKAGAEKALLERPVPGKANGVLLLNQPLLIEAYVGLMAMVGNQNKLGYCLARGHIGL
ncbi:unnamed protein product [Arctogadus glacialis]